MRIEEFRIDRYGPLSGFCFERRRNLTLLFGPNEWGKTLIIDALLKLLFKTGVKRHQKHFGNMGRVDEAPEGYVVIDSAGQPHKLKRTESVSMFYPVEVTPLDFRNVFMIRDSDLSVTDEAGYFTEVTEKLTGLRTAEIQRVMAAVRKKGRLTGARADAPLSGSEEFGRVAVKVEAAAELAGEAAALRGRLAGNRYDELQRELSGARHRLAETTRLLDEQKRAAKRQAVEKAAGHLAELRSITERLEGQVEITEVRFETWQRTEWDLLKMKESREANVGSLAEIRSRGEMGRQALADLQIEVKLAEEIKQVADLKLEPQIQDCRRMQQRISRAAAREGADKWALYFCLAVLLAALIGSIFTPSMFVWVAGALSLTGTAYFGWRVLSLYQLKGRLAELIDVLFLDASECGLEAGGSLEELLRTIEGLERRLEQLRRRTGRAEQEQQALERETGRLEARLAEQNDTIAGAEAEIRSLQAVSKFELLSDFKAALQRKREDEKKKLALEAVLASLLGTSLGGKRDIAVWEEAIERSRRDLRGPAGERYDPTRVKSLEAEAVSLQAKIDDLGERLESARREIQRLQSRLSTLDLPVHLPDEFSSTAALEALEDRLGAFVADIRERADLARTALRLLEKIDEEERSRVSRLFGSGMPVSAYFAEFTDNRYNGVSFDPERSMIYAHRPDGSRLEAGSLSGGAFDQLYLAVRLSIGERFLKGDAGFFILDDPFIKSDTDRLRRQLDSLIRLAERGWQILYFSAKSEVRDILGGRPQAETIDVVDLGSRFSLEPS